jgi:Ca2+-binding EF-hand superfamily protein
VDEIMYVIGGDDASNYDKEIWSNIMDEVDKKGEGKITFKEFADMMKDGEDC